MSQHQYLFFNGNNTGTYGKIFRLDDTGKTYEITVNWLYAPVTGMTAAAFSLDDSYCVVLSSANPAIRLLKRISSAQWDELPTANITVGSFDSISVGKRCCAFSPDGKWLAIGNNLGYFTIYALNTTNDTLAAVEASTACGSSALINIAWRGSTFVTVVSESTSPYLYHFDVNTTTGAKTSATITYSGTGATPASTDDKAYYSPDGTRLVLVSTNSGSTRTYSISGTTYTIDTAFDFSGIVVDRAVWSADGTIFAISKSISPYYQAWKLIGGSFIPFNALADVTSRTTLGIALSADNKHLYAGTSSTSDTLGRIQRFYIDHDSLSLTQDNIVISSYATVTNALAISNNFTTVTETTQLYNHTLSDLVLGNFTLTTLKIALMNSSAAFDATNTTLAQVLGANEVYGSTWPQGGVLLTSTAYSSQADGDAAFEIVIPDTTLNDPGTITFRSAVIYDDTDVNDKPVAFINFGVDKTANQFDVVSFALATASLIYFNK